MFLITVSTKDRLWHFALTLLSLANASLPDCCIELFDDASDTGTRKLKHELWNDFATKRQMPTIYGCATETQGYNGVQAHFYDSFINCPSFTHRLHFDDDMVIGPGEIVRAFEDYKRWVHGGYLCVFVNPWSKPTLQIEGPIWRVQATGGAAFLVSRETALAIGNVHAEHRALHPHDAQGKMWERYHHCHLPLCVNRDVPYAIQTSGNVESVIFGRTDGTGVEAWRNYESLYSKSLTNGTLIDVPPYGTNRLREAVKSGTLERFVRECNERATVKVLLP